MTKSGDVKGKENGKMIEKQLNLIISSYYNKSDNCYNRFRYDEDENSMDIVDEVSQLLTSKGIDFKVELTYGYESCAYDCDVLSVAWVENGDVHLRTQLIELY